MQLQALAVVVFATSALALPPRVMKLGKRDFRDWACNLIKTGLLVNEFRFIDVDADIKWGPGREFLNDVAGCEDARVQKVELSSSVWATGTIFGMTDRGRCGPLAAPAEAGSLQPGIYQRLNDESQFEIVRVAAGDGGQASVEEVEGQSPIPSIMGGDGPQYCYDTAGRPVQNQGSQLGAVPPVGQQSAYGSPGQSAQPIAQRPQSSEPTVNNQSSEESQRRLPEQLRGERDSIPSAGRQYQSSARVQNAPSVVVDTVEDQDRNLSNDDGRLKSRWS